MSKFRRPFGALVQNGSFEIFFKNVPITSADTGSFAETGQIGVSDKDAFLADPAMGLMIQVSSLSSTTDLTAWLENVRLNHRSVGAGNPTYINNITLQDIADSSGTLYTTYLDIIAPYLPGGATPAFDRAFVGTAQLTWGGAGSPYIEGIEDATFRASNVSVATTAANAFKTRYPSAVYDWYITYEANCAGFWDVNIKNGYKTYFSSLMSALNGVTAGKTFMWSPAFWSSYSSETSGNQTSLLTNFTDLFSTLSSPMIFNMQDGVGAGNLTQSQSLEWYNWLKSNFSSYLSDLQMNPEQFTGAFVAGDPVEVPTRETYYVNNGVKLGTAFEIRYWYTRAGGGSRDAAASPQVAISSSDTGSGADSSTSIALSTADTASGADSQKISVSSSDTGSGLESSPSIGISSADTGSGSDTSVKVSLTAADTGSGLDSQSGPNVQAASDTGTGTEASTLATTVSSSDTGSGLEANTLTAQVPTSDTGSGAESQSIAATLTTTDASSAAVESAKIAISSSDTGSGLEGFKIGIAASDTASGAESNGSIAAALSSADTAAGTDNASTSATLAVTETGTFAEATTITAAISQSDSLAGVDTETTTNPVSSSDTFTGTESASTVVAVTSTETMSGADTAHIGVTSADVASFVDVGTAGATLSDADAVTLAEFAFSVASISDTDVASFADTGTGGLTDFEFGVFTDTESYSVLTSSTDVFAGAESATVGVVDSDTGSALEAVTALRVVALTDTVSVAETASIHVVLSSSDAMAGVDLASVRATFSVGDTGTANETQGVLFGISDADSAFFDDEEASSASLASGDTATASENVRIGLASNEVIGVSEQQAVGASVSNADVGSASDNATSIRITQSDNGTFTELGVIHLSDSDSLVAVEAVTGTGISTSDAIGSVEIATIRLSSSDTVSFLDSALIGLTFPTDVVSFTEAATALSVGIGLSSSDTAHSSEVWSLRVVAEGETAQSIEKHKIGVSDTDAWDPLEVAVISFNLGDTGSSSESAGVQSGPSHATDDVNFTESASVRLLYIDSTQRLGPLRNPLAPVQPYYLRKNERWAVDNERQRHLQALYLYGEWTMFVLMWHQEDLNNGLVTHCQRCYGASPQVRTREQRASAAFGNVSEYKCPNCYGTTFEGGFKAIIVRPAIFADTDESQQFGPRGVVNGGSLDMESTPDFRVRTGDYSFRSTGDRYQLQVPERVTLRTGFATPYQRADAIGYNHAKASIEDPTAVAYTIPPSREDLVSILNVADSYTPVDFSSFEVIRSPLIPIGDDQG